MSLRGIYIFTALSLSGCASIDVPDRPTFESQIIESTSRAEKFRHQYDWGEDEVATNWWLSFGDETLNDLIGAALESNARLASAQAAVKLGQASLARQKLSSSIDVTTSSALNNTATIEPDNDIETSLRAGVAASWEYDVFGRIASLIRASDLNVEALNEAYRDLIVIVSSDTALTYVSLRGAQKRLTTARDNADVQAQSLKLLEALLENGRATELDVNRAKAQYKTTLATLPQFQATIDQSISTLSRLTGESAIKPSESIVSLERAETLNVLDRTDLYIGSPSELLRRRPDIRQAEIEIARRLALGEVERADLFPRITFNAEAFSLLNINTLFARPSTLGLGFGPALSWDGPDLRRVHADISVADAQTELAMTNYVETVLGAIADVEVSLSNIANEYDRREPLNEAVIAARKALDLAQLRFEEGVDDFLDVLDAQ